MLKFTYPVLLTMCKHRGFFVCVRGVFFCLFFFLFFVGRGLDYENLDEFLCEKKNACP